MRSERARAREISSIGLRQGRSADQIGKVARLPRTRECREQLRGSSRVVGPRTPRSGPFAHESRERREHVDRRIYAGALKLRGKDDLPLRDVTGEIGNRVRDVARRHRQHRNERERTAAPANAAAALVDRREIAIEITRIRAPARRFAPRCRDFAQRFAIARHVGENDEDVLIAFERQILGDRQRDAGRKDALHHRIVGRVEEER